MASTRDKKVDNEDLVLINIPAGKKPLALDEAQLQAGQKENTCWYYNFNLLRPRLGKLEEKFKDEIKKGVDPANTDLTELLKKRKTEKIISQFRRNITELEIKLTSSLQQVERANTREQVKKFLAENSKLYELLSKILEGKTSDQMSKLLPPAMLKLLPSQLNHFKLDDLKNNITLLENFLKQNKVDTLEDFVQNNFYKQYIQFQKKLLSDLGHDPEKEFKQQLQFSQMIELEDKNISLDKVRMIYNLAVYRIAADAYHLKVSNWNPADGFQSLMKTLKEEGPLAMGAYLGIPVYKKSPKKEAAKIGNYEVYYWSKVDSEKNETNRPHAILIVGAQRIPTSKGKQDTVLYIDPADESEVNKPRKIYRVSYENFCNNLTNIHGVLMPNKKMLKGPFAFFQDKAYKAETEQQYERLLEETHRKRV